MLRAGIALSFSLHYNPGLARLLRSIASGELPKHLSSRGVQQSCEIGNVYVRRECSMLSDQEKLAYTTAMKCLMASPSNIPPGLAPGAKSRYDDFVAIHINQTDVIHFTGSFFLWHRYYLWAFETALRQECGYDGYLPYWNWGKSAKDLLHSLYFDGSQYSQGGNGIWAPHSCTDVQPQGLYCTPVVQGQGGGCVQTGPYAGIPTNLSATRPGLVAPDAPMPGPFLGYQPRCIRRDISADLALRILAVPGGLVPGHITDIGPHGVAHYVYAGDPGGDLYNSPGDPMFWLTHTMVDRVSWIWQNQKPIERAFMINGTRTILNDPLSEQATVEDFLTVN
ncbi:Di-copper centre-containing protein [Thozetella sp. PMI_491]|nr:Di-copper centre-containing protein [Thozetella sp. PMI_491]